MTASHDSPPRASKLVTEDMEKPSLDDRSYRVIRLDNQLEALLIHDPETDKGSASLDVNVGNFSDPDDLPGLAHAVEHLLFMGTKKVNYQNWIARLYIETNISLQYPEENAYQQYLATRSGFSNAWTAPTSTNYYFEVGTGLSHTSPSAATSQAEASKSPTPSEAEPPLYGALDRFAQFFIAPLFLEDSVDRELRAVDSENKKNLQNDSWRLHQLNKSLSNPNHPYCHFSTGNYETLRDGPIKRGVQIRDECMRFHADHYSANRMKLVVLGKESLDTLQSWVEEFFGPIENKNLDQNRWDDQSPYTEKEIGMQIFAKPVFDMRTLDIYFPYPDEEALYESQPSRYLSHLVGHEGPGSILAYLKNKGWANGLGAGASPICPGAAFFSISIRLTEAGLEQYQQVAKIVFQYIAMLREQPPHEWIFEEQSRMSKVDFRFKQKYSASKTTSGLSQTMQRPIDRSKLISGPELISTFNPDAIKRGLAALNPDNFRLTLVSQAHPGDWDQREKFYGTEYRYERIPSEFMREIQEAANVKTSNWPRELHLPQPNEFIPSPDSLNIEKKEGIEPMKHPKLIRNDDKARIWFKKDDRYWVPKANLHITLRSPIVALSPYNMAMAQLYQALVQDDLVEYSYAAEIAGLEYNLSTHSLGLDITINGYNDKMLVLLDKVVKRVRDLDIQEDRFDIVKERLMRGYRNWDYQQPYQQIGAYTRWLQHEKGWINEQYAAELPHVSLQDLKLFGKQLLRQLHVETLAHGNLHKEDALKFTDLVESTLRPRRLPADQWNVRRCLLYPEGSSFVYQKELKDPANVNHCVEYLLYCGNNQDRELRARILLLAQIAQEKVFDTLRTKEQLGYVVFGGASLGVTWAGYRILIQSERHPDYLEGRIDSFLLQLGEDIKTMDDTVFETNKKSIINKRLERLKNLSQESNRFWNHIVSEGFDFEQGVSSLEVTYKI